MCHGLCVMCYVQSICYLKIKKQTIPMSALALSLALLFSLFCFCPLGCGFCFGFRRGLDLRRGDTLHLLPFARGAGRFLLGGSFLEFFHATGRIYQHLLARVEGVRGRRNFNWDHLIGDTVQRPRVAFFSGGNSKKFGAAGGIDKDRRVTDWVDVGFHIYLVWREYSSGGRRCQ